MWSPWIDARVRVAALFVAAAAAALIGGGLYALRDAVVVPTAPLRVDFTAAGERTAPVASPAHVVQLDPFAESQSPAMNIVEAPSQPPVVLVGTIAGNASPSAICRLGALPPRILHVGDTLGGWRLSRVSPGSAVFIDATGAAHELRLSPQRN